MNKRLIAFLSIFSLFLSLSLTPVSAATKAGGTCKKVGLKSVVSNKSFTCIKFGKKLVWDKGTIIAAPVAIQSAWLKGYSEISSISRNNKINFNLENIEISPNIDSKLAENLLKYQNLVSSYWKSYGFESQYPISVLILSEKDYSTYVKHSTKRKFSCSYCTESNWFSPSFSSKFQGTVLVEDDYGRISPTGLTILYVIGTEMVSKNYNWAPDLATAFTHEYGHAIQFSYLEGWKNFGQMSCWNNEGFPAFFEDAFYYENVLEKSKMNLLSPPNGTSLNWLDLRRTIRENGFKYEANRVFNSLGISYSGSDSDWTKFFTYTDTRNSDGCSLVGYGRNHGSIISRLFYEDFSAKSFLEILNNTNQKKDWKSAFVATTGKEYDSWLKERVFPEFKNIK